MALDPARLLQRRAGHLERHLLRQLAQMTRREPPSDHRHGTEMTHQSTAGLLVTRLSLADKPHLQEPCTHHTKRHTLTAINPLNSPALPLEAFH
jgi:hypothetical protein